MILRDVVSEIDFERDFIEFRKFLFRRATCENIVQKHYSPVYFYIFVFINRIDYILKIKWINPWYFENELH